MPEPLALLGDATPNPPTAITTTPGQGQIVARRLALHSRLPADPNSLERLLGAPTLFEPRALIAEAGDTADLVTIMQDGSACRMSLLPDGRRQIHTLLLPGDTADAEAPLLPVRPDNIEALSRCSVWCVPQARMADLIQDSPLLVQAFARETAIAAQVAREWLVNIGQRDATERIAHFLCELHTRLLAIGLADPDGFTLPLTQADIADAQGLTSVHVSRVMKDLRLRGLIQVEQRRVTIPSVRKLRAVGLFDPLYLYLQPIEALS